MLLYHFTCREHLPAIMRDGLSRGEVPITQIECQNAVWLTTDAEPEGHGLSVAGEVPDIERETAARLGVTIPPGARYADKRAVRITVKISRFNRRLAHWPTWAKKRLDPDWYAALTNTAKTGGSAAPKDHTWWIYFGTIAATDFVKVEMRSEE